MHGTIWLIGNIGFTYESHIHTLLTSISNAMPFHPRRGPQCGFSRQLCPHPTKDEGLCPGEQSLISVHDKPCGNCAQWIKENITIICIPLNSSACFLYFNLQVDLLWPIIHLLLTLHLPVGVWQKTWGFTGHNTTKYLSKPPCSWIYLQLNSWDKDTWTCFTLVHVHQYVSKMCVLSPSLHIVKQHFCVPSLLASSTWKNQDLS